MLEEVLRLRKAKLGLDHPDTMTSMNNLAGSYEEMKRWAEAESLLRDCLRLREKTTARRVASVPYDESARHITGRTGKPHRS